MTRQDDARFKPLTWRLADALDAREPATLSLVGDDLVVARDGGSSRELLRRPVSAVHRWDPGGWNPRSRAPRATMSAIQLRAGRTRVTIGCRRCRMPESRYDGSVTDCDYTLEFEEFTRLLRELEIQRARWQLPDTDPFRGRDELPKGAPIAVFGAVAPPDFARRREQSSIVTLTVMLLVTTVAVGLLQSTALLLLTAGVAIAWTVSFYRILSERPEPLPALREPLAQARPRVFLDDDTLTLEDPWDRQIVSWPRADIELARLVGGADEPTRYRYRPGRTLLVRAPTRAKDIVLVGVLPSPGEREREDENEDEDEDEDELEAALQRLPSAAPPVTARAYEITGYAVAALLRELRSAGA